MTKGYNDNTPLIGMGHQDYISPNQDIKSPLKPYSRPGPSVDVHHYVNSSDTGRNSGGRQKKGKKS